jgi:hypothetical protein
MNLLVLPHSGLHATDVLTSPNYLLSALAMKMVVIGLPIAYSVRRFAPAR